jgi:hypothetical protein
MSRAEAWSSSDDESDVAPVGPGPALRRNLLRFASVDSTAQSSRTGAVAKALESAAAGVPEGAVEGRVGASLADDHASAILLEGLTDEELLQMRHDAVLQVKSELLVPSELEAKTQSLLVSCHRDRFEILRSMNHTATEQAKDAAASIAIIRGSEQAIEHLKEGFQTIHAMIGTMESVESYARLRELHYYRMNSDSIVQWCRVFGSMSEPDQYESAIEEGSELPAVYEDIVVMQKIRTSLGQVASRYRGQLAAMRPTFDIADHLVSKLVERIKGVVQTTCRTAVGENLPGHDEDHGDVANLTLRRRELLIEVLKIVDKENGHDGDHLKYRGGTGSYPHDPDCANMDSPIHTEVMVACLQEGAADLFHADLMVDSQGMVATHPTALVNAIETTIELLPVIEESLLPIRTNIKLTSNIISGLHSCVMEGVSHFIAEAQESDSVSAQELLNLLHAIDHYREAVVDYGGIVSNYANTDDMDYEQRRLLDAAVDGLQDHMINLCVSCSLSGVNETIRRAKIPDPDMPVAALDVMAVIDSSAKSLVSGANLTILHKLAVAVAAAIQNFVEDQLQRTDWAKFHSAVEVYFEEWVQHNNIEATEGADPAQATATAAAAAAAKKKKAAKKGGGFFGWGKKKDESKEAEQQVQLEGAKPLVPKEQATNDAWLAWQLTALNGFSDMQKKIPHIERYFSALHDADEVELNLAGALAEEGTRKSATGPGSPTGTDMAARWESPITAVMADFDVVNNSLLDRIIQYMCDIEMGAAWEAMFVSNEWQANPSPRPPTDDIFGVARTTIMEVSPALRDPWAGRLRSRLVWHVSVMYLENMARFMKSGQKKWLFNRNVDRDIDLFSVFWESVLEGDNDAVAMGQKAVAALRAVLKFMTSPDVERFTKVLENEFLVEFPDTPEFFPLLLIANRMDVDKKTREGMERAFHTAYPHRPAMRPGAAPSLVGCVDEAVVNEARARGGWFSRAPTKAEVAVPGQRKNTAGSVPVSQMIHVDASSPGPAPAPKPKAKRRKTAAPPPDKKKGAPEPAVMSLADALAAANK